MNLQKTLTSKNNLEKISIENFTENLPDLKNISEAKAVVIGKWLTDEITKGFRKKIFKNGQLLPKKAEFAYRLGVSIGTIQNALQYCEDFGCIDAKPCIGTVVKEPNATQLFNQKTSSIQNTVTGEIKKYLKEHKYQKGDIISSPKVISVSINRPVNTVRLALESLCSNGILKHIYRNGVGKTGWYLETESFNTETQISEIKTLVDKTVDDLKEYIRKNHKRGEKIKSHAEFAKILNVSMSTIHTAFNILSKEGILKTRRGQYGTTIIKMPDEKLEAKPEMSIFAPASEAVNYYYEKIQTQIKRMIAQNYEIGDKLPPITKISQSFDISPNTVRKALLKIGEEGYVKSLRGRYGGTVVIDIPETENQSFRWLAVNPSYVKQKNNVY